MPPLIRSKLCSSILSQNLTSKSRDDDVQRRVGTEKPPLRALQYPRAGRSDVSSRYCVNCKFKVREVLVSHMTHSGKLEEGQSTGRAHMGAMHAWEGDLFTAEGTPVRREGGREGGGSSPGATAGDGLGPG